MKISVQILLVAGLMLPLFSSAREETLEERKRRIMRKYLREHTLVIQTDLMVPEEIEDDQTVVDSEKYKNVEEEFERHETDSIHSSAQPLPRRPLRKKEGRNWLLGEEESLEDPYASEQIDSTDSMEQDFLSQWGLTDDSYSRNETSRSRRLERQESWTRQQEDYTANQRGIPDRSTDNYFGFGTQRDSRSWTESRGLFGRQADEVDQRGSMNSFRRTPSDTYSGSTLFRQPRSQASDSPFITGRSGSGTDNQTTFGSEARKQQQQPGLIPYRNPYQTQSQEPSPTRQNGTSPVQQQEFRRTNQYEKWKKKSRGPNPMRDDAYLNPTP